MKFLDLQLLLLTSSCGISALTFSQKVSHTPVRNRSYRDVSDGIGSQKVLGEAGKRKWGGSKTRSHGLPIDVRLLLNKL